MRARAAAALFGFVMFLGNGGFRILDPTNVAWIAPGSDYAYHQAGWTFYRHAGWSLWPLGAIPELQWPAGSTVGFNDGIPWLAAGMKLLSPILPEPFQYIGLWLALCFVLQGWFGARLAQTLSPTARPLTAAMTGAFFVVQPILLHRLRHEALCAHFVILAAIGLCLRPSTRAPRAAPVLLTALAMGIHPYLAVMVAALGLGAVARAWRVGRFGAGTAAGLAAAIPLVMVALSFWLGYLGVGARADVGALGFGSFSTDVLSFLEPGRYSWVLPARAPRPGVFEDPGYLGLGGLLLGISAIVLGVVARRRHEPPLGWRRALPLLVPVLGLAFYAVSPRITAFGRVLVDLSALYRPIGSLTGPFRIAGRFIWPLTYTLTAAAIAVWLLRRPHRAPWVLLFCGVVQMSDMRRLMFVRRWHETFPPRAWAAEWELARGDFRHLALYPPRCADASFTCCGAFTPRPHDEDFYLAALATRLGVTLNSGGTARAFRTRFAPYCDALAAAVSGGRLDERTIYWVAKERQAEFVAANPRAPCKPLDGELACVSPEAKGPFRDFLAGHVP